MKLFFGMEVVAPWPETFPQGRILDERHLTLAFLGDAEIPNLANFPEPPFSIGIAAFFDRSLFLPQRLPRVAAWHVHLLEEDLIGYQKKLIEWLQLKDRFLPHVTIARRPFKQKDWGESFQKLPLYLKNIHLLESLGFSKYKSLWNFPIAAPFVEIEHTADIAFVIRGKDFHQLCLHAQLALSFQFPPLVAYFDAAEVASLEEAIQRLNEIIARADGDIGIPFKAVSFHGNIKSHKWMEWEMIVDV